MPLTPHEACLESKAERIARIITRQYGVKVRIEGGRAYIDLDTMTIVMPNLKGDALEHIRGVLDGFLDHECAHAIFTDNLAVKPLKGKPIFAIWNPVEDCWIEREMGKLYVGCAQNLKELNEAIIVEVRKNWGKMGAVPRLLSALIMCWQGSALPAEFEVDPLMGLVFQALEPERRDGFNVNSTTEAINLARRIMDKIASMVPPPPPQLKLQPGQEGKGSEGEGQQGKQQDPKEQQEGEEGGQQGPHTQEGQQEGQSLQEPQEAAGEPSEGEGQEEQDEALQEQAEGLQQAMQTGDYEPLLDAEGLLNDILTRVPDRSKASDPEEYLVFSEEFDTEVHYDHQKRMIWSGEYKELRDEVHDYLGNMATALELSLAAEAQARWVGGSRKGRKFDKRVFPAWTQGGRDDRIFRQLEQSEDWDTAVSLLWDCSGSMNRVHPGSKSYLARLAAIAFHEALSRADIMHEVLGFNTGGGSSPELKMRAKEAEKRGENIKRYSRLAELDKRMVFVPWGSIDGRAICAINGTNANRDAECVMWAAKRLAARPEKRKVLIVGSDGQPSGAKYGYTEKKYLQEVIAQVIEAGIELYAIGIMDDAVSKYYPHWVVIHRVEDLPQAVMQQLGQALFARKGTMHGNVPAVNKPSGGERSV